MAKGMYKWLKNKAKEGAKKLQLRLLLFSFLLLIKWPDDQPNAFVIGEIVPYPVIKNHQLISETNKVQQMNEHPGSPGSKSSKT